MALSLILEQVVGHFTIDRIADFFFYTGRTTIKTERGGVGWLYFKNILSFIPLNLLYNLYECMHNEFN